jgi:outer membrane receptor protein involved in Fe transport
MTCVGETYSELPTPQYPTDPELIAGEYTIFGAKISQPFLEHFEAFVAAKNIFDKNYEPEVGYPAPGRSFWVGLSATF